MEAPLLASLAEDGSGQPAGSAHSGQGFARQAAASLPSPWEDAELGMAPSVQVPALLRLWRWHVHLSQYGVCAHASGDSPATAPGRS